MLKIEFFGPSGSGKTYFKKKLIKNYFKDFEVFDYRKINFQFNHKSLILSLYFKTIKNENIKKIKNFFYKKKLNISVLNFFYKSYMKKINLSASQKQNSKLKLIQKLVNNSIFKSHQKKIIFNWAKEEFIASQIIKGIKKDKKILIDSEGFLQRLFLYCYKKKDKDKIIRNYLSIIDLPDIVIVFNKFFFNKKNFLKLNKRETILIYNLVLKALRKKKILIFNSSEKMEQIAKKINKLTK